MYCVHDAVLAGTVAGAVVVILIIVAIITLTCVALGIRHRRKDSSNGNYSCPYKRSHCLNMAYYYGIDICTEVPHPPTPPHYSSAT